MASTFPRPKNSPTTVQNATVSYSCSKATSTIKTVTTLIDELREKVDTDQFELSRHATDQSIRRHISLREVREAIASGGVIEEYPEDKYWPSYLVYGTTTEGRPLHVQCSHPSRPLVKIVTLYEPDPARWIDFKERRPG